LRERLRSTSFRLFTLSLGALTATAIIAMDVLPRVFGDESAVELAVVREDATQVEAALNDSAKALDLELDVIPYTTRTEAETALADGDVDAVLDGKTLVFESEENATLTAVVNRALFLAALPERLEELGLTPAQASSLLSPEGAEVTLLDPTTEDNENRRGLAALAAIGLYLTLALYGNWILMGVVEEKTSRIVEVLLGLVRPQHLLAGKTIGILLVAILQLLSAVVGGIAAILVLGAVDLPGFVLDVVLASIVFFLLGLMLFALLYAALGATVSRQSEAQSAAMPATFFLLVPYLISLSYVPQEPDSAVSVFLSLFPFTSPLTMPTRIAVGSPSILEIVVSIGLLLPTIGLVAWIGGNVYARTILSGGRVSLMRAILGPKSMTQSGVVREP
jgi:ABC-2 type transport system permease protein